MQTPRLIQTYLPDGTLEGVRVIELSESTVKAFVVPRLKLNDIKDRPELQQPALYLLIGSDDNQVYIGECENFDHRLKDHIQNKPFWDIAVAIVSATNTLEKSDVKYLESLAVERAQQTAAMEVLNKTVPARNTIHEFKLHSLHIILDDVALIAESLGYSVFISKPENPEDVWICKSKKTEAKAIFKGDQFVILKGSIIDKSYAPNLESNHPETIQNRQNLLTKYGRDLGNDTVELTDNIAFKSPNAASKFATGNSINAWLAWKTPSGKTMDETIRRAEK